MAHTALRNNPKLKKVIIIEHLPRFDVSDVDPTGLKPKLAKFANSYIAKEWQSSPMKDLIAIGQHSLDCSGDQITAMYRDGWTNRYDGVHMYGRHGMGAFTRSVA